jgi:hypothetical protein
MVLINNGPAGLRQAHNRELGQQLPDHGPLRRAMTSRDRAMERIFQNAALIDEAPSAKSQFLIDGGKHQLLANPSPTGRTSVHQFMIGVDDFALFLLREEFPNSRLEPHDVECALPAVKRKLADRNVAA